jgi:hypothetical protein
MGAMLLWGKDVKTGELIHISQVANGLKCNCVCPDPRCEGILVARQGEHNEWHFGHLGICKVEQLASEVRTQEENHIDIKQSGRDILEWSAEKALALLVVVVGIGWAVYRLFFSAKKKQPATKARYRLRRAY